MKNTDVCDEKSRCASALYLMSVISQCYSVIVDQGISAPGHGKEVVDELNAIDNCYIYINLCIMFNYLVQKVLFPDVDAHYQPKQ